MSTNSGLRRTFVLLSTCMLGGLLFVGLGCGESVECVVDTDCELGNRCQAQVCVPLSTVPERDSGPAQDGDVEDAGDSEDAAIPDTGPADAPQDAEPDAGTPDAGPPTCDFDGSYTLTADAENPAICDGLMLTACSYATVDGVTRSTYGDAVSECTYDEDCVCTGMSTTDLTEAADFPNNMLTVQSTTVRATCVFTMARSADR